MQGLSTKQKFMVGYFWACCLFCNVWILELLFSPDGNIERTSRQYGIFSFQFILFLIGFAILIKPNWFQFFSRIKLLENCFLLSNMTLILFLGLELLLRTNLFHDLNDSQPVWIPRKLKSIETIINLQNHKTALKNPHYFNDSTRNKAKPNGNNRIAILGDSFIWGDAVPYEKIWSHKLEDKIQDHYPNIEVHSWGRNGWSTLRQIEFIENEGYLYDPDLILIGFVANDPHVHVIERKMFTWQNNTVLKPFEFLFPNIFDFTVSHVNALLQNKFYPDHGYAAWEASLYSDKNLKAYEMVLDSLINVCHKKKLKIGFIFTPSNNLPYYNKIFQRVIPLLEKREIPFLNLAPIVEYKYKGRTPRSLWATPANAHPGEELTNLFAEETFNYIMEEMDHL